MKVSMPTGNTHGWGIAGTYLTAEIAKLPPVDGVTLHCVAGHNFAPRNSSDWGWINIGYCFFEHEILAYNFIPQAAKSWDFIVAGSHWCEHHLRIAGMERTSTILQGVDPACFAFHPPRSDDGRFIVFSGGKFEFRKGQDIAIAAMRIFMQRHPDVWLACSWHNSWPNSIKTMEQSRLIDFAYHDMPCEDIYRQTMARHGLDLSRVILYPLADNNTMSRIYAQSDIGLFPNRCEGGNNMVMCEYMACGRTVIATPRTGHADVLTPVNAFCLDSHTPVLASLGDSYTGVWFEASVEEVLDRLEQAYAERELLHQKGRQAAIDMQCLSWEKAARQFHAIAIELAEAKRQEQPGIAVQVAEADSLFHGGDMARAEAGYRNLLTAFPLNHELHNRLGTVLDRLERYREAIAHYWKALSLNPRFSIARYNLSNSLRRMGDENGALEQLLQLTAEHPEFIEAWKSLAMIYISRDAFSEAALCFEKVVALDPADCTSHCALGNMYSEIGRFSDAIACFNAVLSNEPGNVLALESKGTALHELDDLDGAEFCFRTLLEFDPDRISALNNLGTVLRSRTMTDEAVKIFDHALSIEPDNGQVCFNRAVARLARGEIPRAWAEYEFRFSTKTPPRLSHPDLPCWRGEPLNGRRLLVQSEQGFGDTFQFARYLPLLLDIGGPVVFECQNASVKAGIGVIEGISVVARGEPLGPVDYQVPLLSLPFMFQTGLDSIPLPDGYLRPIPSKVDEWKDRLKINPGQPAVGLVWGGNKYSLNANRSLHVSNLVGLFGLPGFRWFSLQLGPDADQLAPHHTSVTDLREHIHDFGDTAAIIANLDLVLTIDSAVAHLAGALGAKTWVMLKYAPDWRWLLGRNDSPWYSSLRLFRQHKTGDWESVVSSVATALKKMNV